MPQNRASNETESHSEIVESFDRTITLSPDEQLRFWRALQAPVRLTPAQKQLGELMRGGLGRETGEPKERRG